jgi:chromosome partitioning protein
MNKFDNCGLTTKYMSMLAGVSFSAISRFIADEKLKVLEEGSQKRNVRFPLKDCRFILNEYVKKKHVIKDSRSVHAFYNFKGGTGKTSLCYQTATHLSLCGYKVLLVDADPQGHLTVTLGYLDNFDLPTIYDGIINNLSPETVIRPVFEGLDVIPGNLSLTNIEVRLNEMVKKEDVLKRYFEPIRKEYDFIIFDCNPSISNLNRNILNMCGVIDVVCETHPYSVNGMKLLFEDLHRFYNAMQVDLPKIVVIPNKYEDRSNASIEAMSALHKYYEEYLIPDFAVRKSEEFPRSARDQMPISFFCKSNSIAFADICDLVSICLKVSEGKDEKQIMLSA